MEKVTEMTHDLLKGVYTLHGADLPHGQLEGSNIVVDANMKARIIGYVDHSVPYFSDFDINKDKKRDIKSIGILLCSLATGCSEDDFYEVLQEGRYSAFQHRISDNLWNFLVEIRNGSITDIDGIWRHAWFKETHLKSQSVE